MIASQPRSPPVPSDPSSRPTPGIVAPTPAGPGLFLALAPMDGITDGVYRDILTSVAGGVSGISLCATEFVRVTHSAVPSHVLIRECPELGRRGGCTRAGVPVFVQLLGGDPQAMAETARAAAELGAPGIDVNFGCPAKTVNRSDGGATILKSPGRIEAIVGAMRNTVPTHIPISVKVRLGWEDARGIEDIARAAEAAGAAWLTIHARTRLQLYRPPVDWVAIGRARASVRIPVVANGDIDTPQALARCAAQSGCSAFMIGRGAMARPQLFRRLRGLDDDDLEFAGACRLLLAYADALLAVDAPERAVLGRLKQWLRLGAPGSPEMARVFAATKRYAGLAQMREALAREASASVEAA